MVISVSVHEKHIFSVICNVDIEIAFMKYVWSSTPPQFFFAVVCIFRILTLSKKHLCQPPDAYVFLLPVLLFVKSFCFSGLNEPTCLKHWWSWHTFTAVSLSFICSVEVYKFLLMQNQGTNFSCFPFTLSTWVGRGNIIKGMKSCIILTLQSRGYGRSQLSLPLGSGSY